MKSGTYMVSLEMDFINYKNEEEAVEAIRGLCEEMLETRDFSKVNFKLTEEYDVEYNTEEDELEELQF